MRMWMVDPRIMCDKHLRGEHVELHMIVGAMKKYKSLNGYVRNNLIEISSLKQRHDHLVNEMEIRNMNHTSPIFPVLMIGKHFKIYHSVYDIRINRSQALTDLLKRCPKCKKRYERYEQIQSTGQFRFDT